MAVGLPAAAAMSLAAAALTADSLAAACLNAASLAAPSCAAALPTAISATVITGIRLGRVGSTNEGCGDAAAVLCVGIELDFADGVEEPASAFDDQDSALAGDVVPAKAVPLRGAKVPTPAV